MSPFKRKSAALFQAVVFMFIMGCAGAPPAPPDEGVHFWPMPPDEPKIAYISSSFGESNYKKLSFMQELLGDEELVVNNFTKPYGVSVYNDKMYVTDTVARLVFCVDLKEKKITFVGGEYSVPTGVAVSSDGIVFVADAKQQKVLGFDASNKLRIAIGKKGELGQPGGVIVNNRLGRLYIVDSHKHQVHAYSLKGEYLFSFGKRGVEDSEFNFPSNIALDRRNNNICVVDTQNFRVQCFDKDGKFVLKFGQIGNAPGTFSRPKGIGIDSEGNIYVIDAAFDNFQIFNEKGELLLAVGSAGIDPGRFSIPAGMYIDENDRIYAVDTGSKRVQIFQYMSQAWKKANPEEYKKYLLK
ncbi:MAG: hypothetical protein EPN22_13025 [Nitrospirae bacterium]|nr:MAG: hypothetical protein EPN22_13025 [Nitrospirota bacterium]